MAERYLIEAEVGQGGMGTVYRARDIKLARTVALKMISPEAVSGIGSAQFLKEIRHTARLRHHHVLPVHDVAAALQHAHEHQVLHCDIKPEKRPLNGARATSSTVSGVRAPERLRSPWCVRRVSALPPAQSTSPAARE